MSHDLLGWRFLERCAACNLFYGLCICWPNRHLRTNWRRHLKVAVTTSSEYFLSSFTIAPLNSLFFSQEVKLTCLKKHYNLQLMKTWSISFCNWSGLFVCLPSGKDSMQFSFEFISLLIGQLALKLSRWYQMIGSVQLTHVEGLILHVEVLLYRRTGIRSDEHQVCKDRLLGYLRRVTNLDTGEYCNGLTTRMYSSVGLCGLKEGKQGRRRLVGVEDSNTCNEDKVSL